MLFLRLIKRLCYERSWNTESTERGLKVRDDVDSLSYPMLADLTKWTPYSEYSPIFCIENASRCGLSWGDGKALCRLRSECDRRLDDVIVM